MDRDSGATSAALSGRWSSDGSAFPLACRLITDENSEKQPVAENWWQQWKAAGVTLSTGTASFWIRIETNYTHLERLSGILPGGWEDFKIIY